MKRRNLILSPLTLAGLTTTAAHAQSARTVRVIVPIPTGGVVDTTLRILAAQVQQDLGIGFILQNRSDRGGHTGSALLAQSPPDGSTIGIATASSAAIHPWLFSSLPYDPAEFVPIVQIAMIPNVLVMNAARARKLGIATLAQLVAYARQHPAQLSYGTGGNGAPGHLAGEMLKRAAGFSALHVPTISSRAVQKAVVSGDVDYCVDTLPSALDSIRSGHTIALAVTSPGMSPVLPGVPPLSQKVPGFSVMSWWGLVAPKGTPASVVNALNAAFADAMRLPHVRQRFLGLSFEPMPGTPEQFGDFMRSERERMRELVRISDAQVD